MKQRRDNIVLYFAIIVLLLVTAVAKAGGAKSARTPGGAPRGACIGRSPQAVTTTASNSPTASIF